jgi:hypothetical protein
MNYHNRYFSNLIIRSLSAKHVQIGLVLWAIARERDSNEEIEFGNMQAGGRPPAGRYITMAPADTPSSNLAFLCYTLLSSGAFPKW